MATQISYQLTLGYKDIFEDYQKVDIKDLLVNIPTVSALEVVGYFFTQIHAKEMSAGLQLKLLQLWLNRLPTWIHERLENFIHENIINKKDTNFIFINNVSSLILIQYLLDNHNDIPKVDNLTPQQELDIFKAYLYCTQQWTDKQLAPEGELLNIVDALSFTTYYLPTFLPYLELLEFKDFRIQFIKAVYFFEFCETNHSFREYLAVFLKEYGLDNWGKYLVDIISIYVRKFDELRTPSILTVPVEFPDIAHFLIGLSLDRQNYTSSEDFLTLRQKPVYQIGTNEFLFLNLNFLIDKLFQGIQFDFARILIKHKIHYKGKPIKDFSRFKGIYGDEFSEKGLFYQVMDYAFEKCGYKKLPGEQIKKVLVKGGEPDYYMNHNSNIFLFEYKDVLLNSPTKHSYQFDAINDEIIKKLVKNEQGSPKGVTQLVNVIEKIQNREFNKIDNINHFRLKIYPVIVCTDFSFNAVGINYLLNLQFRKLLVERGIKKRQHIHDIVLIDIDSLIKFGDFFRSGDLSLKKLLDTYIASLQTKNFLQQTTPFKQFIHNQSRKLTYNSPENFMKRITEMIAKAQSLP